MYNRNGITLLTQNKYCGDNIEVIPSFPISSNTNVQLFAPTLEVNSNYAKVEDAKNGDFSNSWRIYANGELIAIIDNLAISTDLRPLLSKNGVYAIQAKAFSDLLLASNFSDAVEYVREVYTQGLNFQPYNAGDVFYVAGRGTATNYDLANLVIPPNTNSTPVTGIKENAFANETAIKTIIFPDTMQNIGYNSFENCTNLTSVEFSNSMVEIENDAFLGCSKLKNVYFIGNIDEWCNITFDNFQRESSLYTNPLSNGANLYINNILVEAVTMSSQVTSLGESQFQGCTSIKSVEIPNTVTKMGNYVFKDCVNLETASIGNLTEIGNRTFSYCTKLTNVELGNIPIISAGMFSNCTSLTSITIPNSVTSIDNQAFNRCSSLPSIAIPDLVTSIGNSAFYGCSSSTSLIIGNSVKTIGETAFGNCTNLTSVIIPNSVTSLGRAVFSQCSSLASITLGNSLTAIPNSAFSNCTSLTSVVIPNSVTSIGDYAFNNCSSLTLVDCRNLTVIPALGITVFNSTNSEMRIVVPDALYEDWIVATNWANYANKIIKESEYNNE